MGRAEVKDERMQILRMVADGKITVEEGDKLIEALGAEGRPEEPPRPPRLSGRFLRIRVFEAGERKVNVNIPLELARIALKFVPKESQVKSLDINEVVRLIKEGAQGKIIEVEDGKERVEVYVD